MMSANVPEPTRSFRTVCQFKAPAQKKRKLEGQRRPSVPSYDWRLLPPELWVAVLEHLAPKDLFAFGYAARGRLNLVMPGLVDRALRRAGYCLADPQRTSQKGFSSGSTPSAQQALALRREYALGASVVAQWPHAKPFDGHGLKDAERLFLRGNLLFACNHQSHRSCLNLCDLAADEPQWKSLLKARESLVDWVTSSSGHHLALLCKKANEQYIHFFDLKTSLTSLSTHKISRMRLRRLRAFVDGNVVVGIPGSAGETFLWLQRDNKTPRSDLEKAALVDKRFLVADFRHAKTYDLCPFGRAVAFITRQRHTHVFDFLSGDASLFLAAEMPSHGAQLNFSSDGHSVLEWQPHHPPHIIQSRGDADKRTWHRSPFLLADSRPITLLCHKSFKFLYTIASAGSTLMGVTNHAGDMLSSEVTIPSALFAMTDFTLDAKGRILFTPHQMAGPNNSVRQEVLDLFDRAPLLQPLDPANFDSPLKQIFYDQRRRPLYAVADHRAGGDRLHRFGEHGQTLGPEGRLGLREGEGRLRITPSFDRKAAIVQFDRLAWDDGPLAEKAHQRHICYKVVWSDAHSSL